MAKGCGVSPDLPPTGFKQKAARSEKAQRLTEARPFVAESPRRVGVMSEPSSRVIAFPVEKSEIAAVRLALASILAMGKRDQLELARCGVTMRRAVAGLKVLKPREGVPSPIKAIEELRRACEACGGCRGI